MFLGSLSSESRAFYIFGLPAIYPEILDPITFLGATFTHAFFAGLLVIICLVDLTNVYYVTLS